MQDLTLDSIYLFFNGHDNAIQSALDFDHACGKKYPSLKGIIKPNQSGYKNYFYGCTEILLPIYPNLKAAMEVHPQTIAIVNFASKRSAITVAEEILQFPAVKYQVIIAEGIAERATRILRQKAKKHHHTIFGPSIFGVIKAGIVQLGPAGGPIDLQAQANLHEKGAIAVLTKSGGLVNEFAHIVAQATGNIHSIIAVGGDRYPCSRLIDVLELLENDPDVKLIVMQGEVGGTQELEVVEGIKSGKLTKPLVAFTIGTAAEDFPQEFQFGHAGAMAKSENESAQAKNQRLRQAGAYVPRSFEELTTILKKATADYHLHSRPIKTFEADVYQNRRSASICTSIVDDRGEELYYGSHSISELSGEDKSLGFVIGLLWFKKELPELATSYIELVLKLSADHGPNVAGTHNTIVATRADKDLVSSLASGLLTIGPRFGGASGEAAQNWFDCVQNNINATEFIETLKQQGKTIPGIGHRIKSKFLPDTRVNLLKTFAQNHLQTTPYLSFAQEVELLTLQKNHKLILNIDGVIGAITLDVLAASGFSTKELQNVVEHQVIDALFVLSRSIGLIGHHLDQKRINSPLYRHDSRDVFYWKEEN